MADLAEQIMRRVVGGADDPEAEQVPGVNEDGKIHHALIGYTQYGPQPFVCGQCKFMVPDNTCTKVYGPYGDEMGLVHPMDTCRLWEPIPSILGSEDDAGGVVPGEGDTDEVPSIQEPGEYVLPESMAKRLGYANLEKMRKQSPEYNEDE